MLQNFRMLLLYIFRLVACFAIWSAPLPVIVPVTTIQSSLWLHKLKFSIEVLHLIWLLVSYVPRESLFTSTQFFILNLDIWFGVLSSKFIIFDIPSLFYYINLRSYITFCLSFFIMLIFTFFWIILLWSSWGSCTFISNFMTNQNTRCFFFSWITLFWSSFKCTCCRLFSMLKMFWLYWPLKFLLIFLPIFCSYFLTKRKPHCLLSLGWTEKCVIFCILHFN